MFRLSSKTAGTMCRNTNYIKQAHWQKAFFFIGFFFYLDKSARAVTSITTAVNRILASGSELEKLFEKQYHVIYKMKFVFYYGGKYIYITLQGKSVYVCKKKKVGDDVEKVPLGVYLYFSL